MTINRRRFIATAATASVTAVAMPAILRAQEVHTLRAAHFWPPMAMPQRSLLEPWAAELTEASEGRLQFQLLPSMQVGGSPPQLVDHAINGVADIVWTLPGYTPGRFPAVEAFEMPFMANSGEAASRALWEYYAQSPAVQSEFEMLHPLAFHTTDKYVVHTTEKLVKTLDDFQGLRLRAASKQTNRICQALGAVPISMPFSGIADALSRGSIDGCLLPWEASPTIRLPELAPNHTEVPASAASFAMGVFMIAMNPKSFAGLPDDLQAMITERSGAGLSQHIGKLWDDAGANAREQAVAAGNTFHTLDDATLKGWEGKLLPLRDGWVTEVTDRGLDGAGLLETAQTLIDNVEI